MVLAHDIDDGQRTEDVQISENITFESMLLSNKTLQGLRNSGFYKPSPIQRHGIPLGKCGFDLILEAKSGTGKTAVFTVIALEKLNLNKGLQAAILAPTREIAAQICDVLKEIGSFYKGLHVEVVMGGLPVQDDIAKFKKNVHIVVGSPGRLCHLIKDNYIDVSSVRLLVLDEADKLMEKAFQSDIQYIYSVLPHQKQIIFSSATYPESSKIFLSQFTKSAQHVQPDTNSILLGISQKVCVVQYSSNILAQTSFRIEQLLKILKNKHFKQCLIFCNYQARVAEVHKKLTRNKWPAEQLYGSQQQTERLDALKTLQEYKCRILISTDLAARGIDASNVDLVINLEPPFDWQTYLHRIGRAGRFGSNGSAISIISEGNELNNFKKLIGNISYPLNLTYLWTDEEFEIKEQIEDLSQTLCSTKLLGINKHILDSKLKKMWDVYTGEGKEQSNRVEDFNEICMSYNNCIDDKIDTFSSLMQSFENDTEDSDCVILYQNLGMHSLPVFCHSERNNKFATNPSLDTQFPLETCTETSEMNTHLSEIKYPFAESEMPLDKLIEKTIKNGLPEENMCIFNERQLNNTESYEFDTPSNISHSENLLRSAGLPTKFGKVYNKEKMPNPNYYNVSKPQNSILHGGRDRSSSHKKLTNNVEDLSPNCTTSSSDDSEYESEVDSDASAEDISTSYINWYRQLKFQVEQYELALYIQEMSKLHS